MTTWNEQQFVDFALRNVAWAHGDEGQKQRVIAVGRECYVRAQCGENSSLWHVAATLAGKPCYCASCRPSH